MALKSKGSRVIRLNVMNYATNSQAIIKEIFPSAPKIAKLLNISVINKEPLIIASKFRLKVIVKQLILN
ncbi:hypothetical protein ABSA28_00837 [Candidatus Hepatincolaceae symbiont of Richtersius coronifer]